MRAQDAEVQAIASDAIAKLLKKGNDEIGVRALTAEGRVILRLNSVHRAVIYNV